MARTMMALSLLLCATSCTPRRAPPERSDAADDAGAPVSARVGSPREAWGIEAVSLRPTFGGTMLDFRYRVVDAEKARPLFDRKIKPYLFDPSKGVALGMPENEKLGSLRSSPRNPPVAGKQYYVLFSNGYGTVERGSRVAVVIGDCRLDDVVVD